jgi:hypothetical protein
MSRAGRQITVVAALALLLTTGLAGGAALSWGVVSGTSTISTVSGTGQAGFSGDGGPAQAARLNQPRDSAMGPDGSIYLTDTFNNRIRRISPSGTITTIAGNGSATYNGDGIPATSASLSWPHDVTVDSAGVVYIADSDHYRIRRVGLNGVITTIAGTGVGGSNGDGGPATSARIAKPKTVALYGGGLYTAGLDNKVRRIDLTTGIITTVAGTGAAGYSGDGGRATSARLNGPQRVEIDSLGNIYIADTLNSVIRRVDAVTGIIRTIAGVGGTTGSTGDGGQATAARLNHPRGLTLEGDRIVYIADSDNHRVRAVDLTTGIITRIAGSSAGYSGNGGPASAARLRQPRGLTITPQGDLLVAETGNSVLRRIAGTPLP